MLGHYEDFPENIHGIARFTYRASLRKVQQATVKVLYRLNRRKCRLEEITYPSTPRCEVGFEFGIGEERTFVFLDENELSLLEDEIERNALIFLDFFCALQYHTFDKSRKRAPLKFDYYLLRFAFDRNHLEFMVFHERGPQRVHVEDLIGFLTENIKKELADRYSAVLRLESSRTV